jgi:hypothetical protein
VSCGAQEPFLRAAPPSGPLTCGVKEPPIPPPQTRSLLLYLPERSNFSPTPRRPSLRYRPPRKRRPPLLGTGVLCLLSLDAGPGICRLLALKRRNRNSRSLTRPAFDASPRRRLSMQPSMPALDPDLQRTRATPALALMRDPDLCLDAPLP